MNVSETALPGVLLIEPRKFGDARGFFMETWRENSYREAGIQESFVQDNVSFSQYGVLRGLHFQLPRAQGKLVYCPYGEVYDVAVDIRQGSPTFGQWLGISLSADNGRQMYVPPGFAHAFCVTSEQAVFSYKCTAYYDPQGDAGVRWNDPDIGIEWPVAEPTVSDKDADTPLLKDMPADKLPVFVRARLDE